MMLIPMMIGIAHNVGLKACDGTNCASPNVMKAV